MRKDGIAPNESASSPALIRSFEAKDQKDVAELFKRVSLAHEALA
jgi:hypothetical protein